MQVDVIKLAKKKQRIKTNPARIGVFIFFVLYSLIMLFMLLWAVLASFNEHNELLINNSFFPKVFHPENYFNAYIIAQKYENVNRFYEISQSCEILANSWLIGALRKS